VEGVEFIVSEDLLKEGTLYLKGLLSGQWADSSNMTTKLTVPVPLEGFKEILAFLQTGFMPLYYDNHSGFDIAKYTRVFATAKFLGVQVLSKWIETRSYEAVVVKSKGVLVVPRETQLRTPC